MVSMLAVVIPVAAMVILLSVFNGFESLIRDFYKVVDADIEITAEGGLTTSDTQFRDVVQSVKGVKALSFIIERQAMLSYRDNRKTVLLRGVDENYNMVVPIESYISLGNACVELGELDRLLLGELAAYELGLYTMSAGDVEVLSLGGGSIGSSLPVVPMHRESLDMCGTFILEQQSSSSLAITSLRAACRIFNREKADRLLIKVAEGYSHKGVATKLRDQLGKEYEVVLREEKNKGFYAIMRYEKWAIFFVSLLVLIVASLSIIGTMIILIMEKREEQKTLFSIGADSSFIRGVFIREGLLISGVGGFIGLFIGVVVTLTQQFFGLVKMPNGNFLVEDYPVDLQALDLVAIFTVFMMVAFAVSMAATSAMIKWKKR